MRTLAIAGSLLALALAGTATAQDVKVDYDKAANFGAIRTFSLNLATPWGNPLGEKRAIAAWEDIVKAASEVYAADLAFGVHAVGFPGHWREELKRLRQGLEQLAQQRAALGDQSSKRASILAAQMESDSDKPLMAWVMYSTRQVL